MSSVNTWTVLPDSLDYDASRVRPFSPGGFANDFTDPH